MGQHVAAETVVAHHAVFALPEEQADAGHTDPLARLDTGIQGRHASRKPQRAVIGSHDVAMPCARPSDGHHGTPPLRGLYVVEGEGSVRGTSALGLHGERVARREALLAGRKVSACGIAAVGIIYGGGGLGVKQAEVERLHAGELRRGHAARILKAQQPLHGIVVRPALHLTLYPQPRLGVGVADKVGHLAVFRWLQPLHRVLPLREQFGRRLSVIEEREGGHVAAAELTLDPAFHIHRLVIERRTTLTSTHIKKQHREGCQ